MANGERVHAGIEVRCAFVKSRELGGSARIFADLVWGEAASKARGVRSLSQVKNTHSEFIILIIQNSTHTIISYTMNRLAPIDQWYEAV